MVKTAMTFLICIAVAACQGGVLRIGICDIESIGSDQRAGRQASEHVVKLIARRDSIETVTRLQMEQALARLGKKMPAHCRDPRCVLDIGAILALDRMVYGAIDADVHRTRVHVYLLDVVRRRTLRDADIIGERNVAIDSVLAVAVARLMDSSGNAVAVREQISPQVHNVKQLLLSSAACMGAGLAWGIVNYCAGNRGGELPFEERNEPLSGIPSSADQIPMFARPAALADAYVAVSDDAYGVLYNPAGMALVQGPEAIAGYQYRFGLNNIAASYVNKATGAVGFGQAFLYSGDKEGILSELCFVSAIACRVNQFINTEQPVSLGVAMKILSDRVRGSDPFSVSGSSLGVGLDAGLLVGLSDRIRYGLLFRDVPVVNRWINRTTGEQYGEAVATTLHMGGSYRAGVSTLLVAEGQLPVERDQSWKMAGGIEQKLFEVIMVRAGLLKTIQSYDETPWTITVGFGLNIDRGTPLGRSFSLDASYEYNTLGVFNVLNVSFKVGW
jgi:hypothetical protein